MEQSNLSILFLQISVILTVALFFGHVMQRLRLPIVLGEFIGGIFLGPTIFGYIAPNIHSWLFPNASLTSGNLQVIVKLGLLFFLFVVGLEVNPIYLRQQRLRTFFISISGIVIPFGLGFGLVILFPDIWGIQAKGNLLLFALFIGTALSISALPVIARILIDLGLMKSKLGMIIMASATIDNFIGWSLFMAILGSFIPKSVIGRNFWIAITIILSVSVLTVSIVRWIDKYVIHRLQLYLNWNYSFIGISAILVLLTSAIFELIGIHEIFGAFLIGIALTKNSEKRKQDYEIIYQFVINFFAPIYFVSIGLKVNLIENFDLTLVLIVLIVSCVGKIGGVSFSALMSKMPIREALAVGFGMNARGAMEIILSSVAFEHNLIDQKIFVALIVMALVTSIISGPFIQRLLKIKL